MSLRVGVEKAIFNSKKYLELLESNVQAINMLADTVRTTLGPKGLDVMLLDQYGEFQCTNDGIEILKNIKLNHPITKLFIALAKKQEDSIGDGTTSVVVFASALLSKALEAIKDGENPLDIIIGIEKAVEHAKLHVKKQAASFDNLDINQLTNLALISARGDKHIANSVVEIVSRLINFYGLDFIKESFDFKNAIRVTTTSDEIKVVDAHFIAKKPHFSYSSDFRDIKTIILDAPLDVDAMSGEEINTEIGVQIYRDNLREFENVIRILAEKGIGAIFASGNISARIEEMLIKENIYVLANLRQIDIDALQTLANSAKLTRKKLFDLALKPDDELWRKHVGDLERVSIFSNPSGSFIKGHNFYPTLMVGAHLKSVAEEKRKIATDTILALQQAIYSGYVLGGGITELNIKHRMKFGLVDIDERYRFGYSIVVDSLSAIFDQIIKNAGFDLDQLMMHDSFEPGIGNVYGLDLDTGELKNYLEYGIYDPAELKLSILQIVQEFSSQVLRLRQIIQT